ncbi:MAG TPA: ribbon-helix-helix protein, CopG family [Pseudolysinimonas sp.]|nr:ribbon-helix-helix protein, CopG family [Pseudolysinimonas sp.]
MTSGADALARRAERGELRPVPGTQRYGPEAAAAGRDALLLATGETTIEDATRVALGRPRLGEQRDAATWRIRAPRALDETLTELAHQANTSRSEIVRIAVAEYARAHAS